MTEKAKRGMTTSQGSSGESVEVFIQVENK